MPRNNPALPAVGANIPIMRVTVTISWQGQLYEVVLDYIASAAVAVNKAAQDAFKASWVVNAQALWLLSLSSDAKIDKITLAEVSIGTCPTATYVINLAGTSAIANSDNGILAAVADKTTAVKGQHGRGRTFFGPLPTSFIDESIDANRLTAAAQTVYQNLCNGLMMVVAAAATTWTLGISTRPIRPNFLVANFGVLSTFSITPVVGTVRRRKVGRGQ